MTPYINPLGFIDKRTQRGVRFLLTNPDESLTLRIATPVTVSQPCNDGRALARTRGEIVAVGYVTATFTIAETLLDAEWPQNEETIRERTPVYLAKENSFEQDPSRMLTVEQTERLRELSNEYTNILRNAPSNDEKAASPPHNHPTTQAPVQQPYPQQLDE